MLLFVRVKKTHYKICYICIFLYVTDTRPFLSEHFNIVRVMDGQRASAIS